jgi:hypothetical protein
MLAAIHRAPSRTSIATERHKVKALTKGLPLMWQSQHEKHPRANGDDEHADDFGVDDVFDDVVHRHDLIDRRLANNASRCGLDVL